MSIKRLAGSVAVAALALSVSACSSTSEPLPQASAAPPAVVAPEVPVVEPEPAEEKATTCDVARESILTGSPADITKAMKGLAADKKADATAREYARYYTGRDKGDKDMQEMDIGLIQMSCSV